MQVLLRLVERQLGLVVLLLRYRAGLNQSFHTRHLGLKVGNAQFGGVILLLIHAYEVAAFLHFVAHFDIDMLYLAGDRRCYIDGLVAQQVRRERNLALYLAGVERSQFYHFRTLSSVLCGCRFLVAATDQCQQSGCKNKLLFHILIIYY